MQREPLVARNCERCATASNELSRGQRVAAGGVRSLQTLAAGGKLSNELRRGRCATAGDALRRGQLATAGDEFSRGQQTWRRASPEGQR